LKDWLLQPLRQVADVVLFAEGGAGVEGAVVVVAGFVVTCARRNSSSALAPVVIAVAIASTVIATAPYRKCVPARFMAGYSTLTKLSGLASAADQVLRPINLQVQERFIAGCAGRFRPRIYGRARRRRCRKTHRPA